MKRNHEIVAIKQVILFLSFPILSFNLSYLPISENNKQIPSIQSNEPIVIITVDQKAPGDGIKVSSINDGEISANCSYHEILEIFKIKARKSGANIIKITEHKLPVSGNSCDRMKADLYKVEDFRKYETEIHWSRDRKLKWEDFKAIAPPDSFKNIAAITYCGIGYHSNRVLLSAPAKIWVTNIFNCNKSWVRENHKNPGVLDHEQLHFDLSEIYARKMRKSFQESNLTGESLNSIGNSIFRIYYQEFEENQNLYDLETGNGLIEDKQTEWDKKIRKELKELIKYEFNNNESTN